MKLVLQSPRGDKNYILFVNELAGDEKYVAYRPCYFECENSERWEADRAIREEWETASGKTSGIFNQCQWVGSTGWEFWTADQDAILKCAMLVAERLGLELEIA